jgi:hypothetical protein
MKAFWIETRFGYGPIVCLLWGSVACSGTTVASGGTMDKSGGPFGSGGGGGSATGGVTSVASGGQGGTGGRSGNGGVVVGAGGVPIPSDAPGSGGLFDTGGNMEGGSGARAEGGALGTGGSADSGPTPPRSCLFTFAVTTVSYNGRFEPHNVAAVWITDSVGTFVKTLATWGGPRLAAALEWQTVSSGNRVDAITSATRRTAGPITAQWNCMDTTGQLVPPGSYSVCVEFEEEVQTSLASCHFTCLPFTLQNGPSGGNWIDEANFVSLSWSLQ